MPNRLKYYWRAVYWPAVLRAAAYITFGLIGLAIGLARFLLPYLPENITLAAGIYAFAVLFFATVLLVVLWRLIR